MFDIGLHFSNTGDDRATPQWLFDSLHHELGFTVDAAANSQNTKLTYYYDEQKDGLRQVWRKGDRIWCNPPYSNVKLWLKKAAESEAMSVLLIAARTDTKGWHEFVFGQADWVLFMKGRLKFNGMKTPAPFPSALVGYKCPPPIGRNILDLGFLLICKSPSVFGSGVRSVEHSVVGDYAVDSLSESHRVLTRVNHPR